MKQTPPAHCILFGRHSLDDLAAALRSHPEVVADSVATRPAPDPSGWITFRERGIATEHAMFAYSDLEHGEHAGGHDVYSGERTVVACRYAPFDGRFIHHLAMTYGGFVQRIEGRKAASWEAVEPVDAARLTMVEKLHADLCQVMPPDAVETLGRVLRDPEMTHSFEAALRDHHERIAAEEAEQNRGMSP